MKVYEALAAAFAAEGTTDVFGMMGDANMHWMNALATRGTRLYEVRHEGAGLSMAHGYARASGRPGNTAGPAVPPASLGLRAYMNSSCRVGTAHQGLRRRTGTLPRSSRSGKEGDGGRLPTRFRPEGRRNERQHAGGPRPWWAVPTLQELIKS